MEFPQIRPGVVHDHDSAGRIVAFFYNSAQGNSAIQVLTAMGVPNDSLGVTPPERIETGQGMVLSIPCADAAMTTKIEALCRSHGAQVHRARR